jgi:hypothetical protein
VARKTPAQTAMVALPRRQMTLAVLLHRQATTMARKEMMKMNAADVGNKSARAGWPKRLLRSLGAVTGLFAAVGAGATVASAQTPDYRAAAVAPASWQAFAQQLQGRFEQRLAADDRDAASFRDYLAQHQAGASASPLRFVAGIWILPDGKIERLEVDGLDDEQIAIRLRALLSQENVGAPPPDMLQPLRLRLSLRPKEPSAGDK